MLADAGAPLAVALTLSWPVLLLIPALGGLIVGPLVYFFAREARGHGVPDLSELLRPRPLKEVSVGKRNGWLSSSRRPTAAIRPGSVSRS